MNYILPEKGFLPMHAGANKAACGNVSVFFGLSGTGKTTLSTQEGRTLIGDDEHGLSDAGIFNFEGGCYAKTYKLSHETEPEIFDACQRFGALLENVVLNEKNEPDFFDKSIAENTRASYPLNFIENMDPKSVGEVPKNMFFLTADAFGVLPPVSFLNRSQALYYFLSGYTAKLAGTEMGVVEPSATFSTCFGAPFMMRKATEYANLLGTYIDRHQIKVWLINTGWTGGAYGVGERFPLKVTRRIIDSIQNGELDGTKYIKEDIFGLRIPESIEGVEAKFLNPKSTWSDSDAFLSTAQKLSTMFKENFKKFNIDDASIQEGGPL
jgi:phosphoenolpyruvate carboxykinase (ATP)